SKRSTGKRDRADIDRAAASCRRCVTLAIKRHSRRKRAQSQQIAQSHDRVEAALLKIDAAACANHSPAIAGDIPRQAQSRSKLVVISVKDRSNLIADLDQPNVWIEIPDQIVGFLDDGIDLVP